MSEDIEMENKKKPEDEEAEESIEKFKKERDEYLDGWKRAKADLSNYKKDEQKRLEELIRFGNEEIVRELIRVLDSFNLALSAEQKSGGEEVKEGMYLVKAQLEDALKKYGLESIVVSPGDQFNPVVHEALVVEETEEPTGTIIKEIEKGYRLHGRVIRPSRVKVTKQKNK